MRCRDNLCVVRCGRTLCLHPGRTLERGPLDRQCCAPRRLRRQRWSANSCASLCGPSGPLPAAHRTGRHLGEGIRDLGHRGAGQRRPQQHATHRRLLGWGAGRAGRRHTGRYAAGPPSTLCRPPRPGAAHCYRPVPWSTRAPPLAPAPPPAVAARIARILGAVDASPPITRLAEPTTDFLKALAPGVALAPLRMALRHADNWVGRREGRPGCWTRCGRLRRLAAADVAGGMANRRQLSALTR